MSRGNSRTRGRTMRMRRWDGRSRITTDWFGYHNDPELNFSGGDIFVFLDGHGSSKRGPSFRLHTEHLATIGFQSLVDQCVTATTPPHWEMPARPNGRASTTVHELGLPAPRDADEDAIQRHHLATRNFFAWLYDRPLTGKTLGASLVDVMRRANLYRPNDAEVNKRAMLAYLDRSGYADFRECVDHALAALYLAESFQFEALWVDAFAHCVGMNHRLHTSIEFEAISLLTKAMITRARLGMDIRLDRVARSLTTFFDSDLSGSYLGLTQIAKEHMDRFRSYLHAYFIEVHGFWPPCGFSSSFARRRSVYRSMYVEFRALYQYLVDPDSTPFLRHNKLMAGAMCTLQNIRAFDTRYKLDTLPRPLPLLPLPPGPSAPLGFTTRKRRMEREARNGAMMKSLGDASNQDPELKRSRLVRRYIQIEKQTVLDDFDPVDLTEGRKIRWILIYAIFQILASVISAPKEVRDTEGLSYPLCCERPKTIPQAIEAKNATVAGLPIDRTMKMKDEEFKAARCRVQELRPDVGHATSRRHGSSMSLATASPIGHARSTSSSTSSLFTTISSKSPRTPSLLRFFHKPKMSSSNAIPGSGPALRAKPKGVQFHEILVCGYGNGLNETIDATKKSHVHPPDSDQLDRQSSFIKTATSPPSVTKDVRPLFPLIAPSLSIAPQKSTPPPLLSATRPLSSRPDRPTVPILPTSPSTSGDSSRDSSTSRNTDDTLNTSEGEAMDHRSVDSADADTATATSSTPILIPTPKPPEPLRLGLSASKPQMCTPTPSKSPPRRVAEQQQQRSNLSPASPSSHSILSSVAGPDQYIRLPSGTGSARMALPKSLFCSPSRTSIHAITEEGAETRRRI